MSEDNQTINKRIAKNTGILYIRMILILVINLYTSRVVLQVLGVEDFGIYNVVGGVVMLLSFLNAALSNGSSRFITYEMGNKQGNVKAIFQSSFVAHVILAVIIVIAAETIGLWFVYNKLIIPSERLSSAVFAYHCSVLTSVVTITQVPYTALIISHERMGIYAYFSIVEAVLKLSVVFLLYRSPFDKLMYYAILLCIVQIGIALGYRIYCIKQYAEATLGNLKADFKKIREIVSFASWSLFGNAAHALNGQGLTIITNLFFSPVVVSARALSVQVNNAAMQFIQNLSTAANPQVVKLYSSGDKKASSNLMLNTARYSFLMMLLIAVPFIVTCEEILGIWLVEIPEYTIIFVQLILVQSLFFTLDTCFYIGLYACGRVRENAIISPSLYFVQFLITYFLFSWGYSPVALSVVGVFTTFTAGVIIKPILLTLYAEYNYFEIVRVLGRCILTATITFPLPLFLLYYMHDSIFASIIKIVSGFLISLIAVLFIGLKKEETLIIKNNISKHLIHKR